jgi:hypothetical protein
VAQLSRPSQAAGADYGTLPQITETRSVAGDQDISRVFPPGDGANMKTIRNLGRHILHAVDRQINSMIQQGLLDFLDKKAFAADLGEGHIQYFVAFGFDGDQFNGQGGVGCAQGSLYPICLP